jgi:hypothetical protein
MVRQSRPPEPTHLVSPLTDRQLRESALADAAGTLDAKIHRLKAVMRSDVMRM